MEGSAKKRRICRNEGIAGGPSCTHTSTEGHKMVTPSGYEYEVFLGFRGPDTRSGFTDFLYTSLIDAGIRTFKDDEELRVGEEFAPELLQAINQSKISIPIFSKGYASSAWCLKELVRMVECQRTGRQKIMPIFYDVAPSKVRHQTGDYGKAFRSHKKKQRYDGETMDQWKAALNAAGEINGWDLHDKTNRREGETVRDIVMKVFNELKKPYTVISDNLVNVDNQVDAIMEMIGVRTSETRIIGIYGMGGIGKTTTAKIIYNQLLTDFEGCCFLANVREMSKRKGIECLQNQLISDILKKKCTDIRTVDEGIKIIKDRLPNKRVLLLLDDVHEKNHMDALVGNRDWFGKGSKLIITTRNKEVIDVLKVDGHYELKGMDRDQSLQLFSKHAFRRNSPLDEYIDQSNRVIDIVKGLPLALEVIGSLLSRTKKEKWNDILEKLEKVLKVDGHYELKGMDCDQSLQLFSKHAFRRNSPLDEYIDQSNRVIDIVKGLPLALEVIGSLLSRTKKEKWNDILEKLEKVPREEVQRNLKISYDALDVRHKHIFLDIACLFIGYNKDIIVHFWEKSTFFPEEAMEVLQNMSLIKIEENNTVWMHDQFRDLGREIVRQESNTRITKQSRVWDPKEGLDLLRKHKGKMEVEALRLKLDNEQQHCFTYEGFENLSDLKFLEVDSWRKYFHAEKRLHWQGSPSNVLLANEDSDLLPQLRWLSWCNTPFTFDITNFSMENVVILNLSGSEITHDWEGWRHMKVMKGLKVLDLSDCLKLKRTPNLSAHSNLERLTMRYCLSLIEIDESICQLSCLVSLDIGHCESLQRLPDELGGGLRSLEYLNLNYCLSLERLPDWIGNLESLIKLDISCTWRLRELPDSIGNLKNLKVVRMDCCELSKILDALWTIGKLEEIEGFGTSVVRRLDVNIGHCIHANQSLRILRLMCSQIYALPWLPESLVHLELDDLYMDKFPDLSNLVHLKELVLRFDSRYLDGKSYGPVEDPIPRWIRDLTNLESLDLCFRCETASPADFILPPQLKSLHLQCPSLRHLPRLPSSLSSLYLADCKSLCSMEDLSNLKKLSTLMIEEAPISEIRGLDRLVSLRDFKLRQLKRLGRLPDLSNLNKLSRLLVQHCFELVEFEGKLPPSLGDLDISFCRSSRKSPDLSNSEGLQEFRIARCDNLVELQLGPLPSLRVLAIKACKSILKVPNLSIMKKLQEVHLFDCGNLVEIQGELPQSLKRLDIGACLSIRQVPNHSHLKELEFFCNGKSTWTPSISKESKGDDNEWAEWNGEDYQSESEGEDVE